MATAVERVDAVVADDHDDESREPGSSDHDQFDSAVVSWDTALERIQHERAESSDDVPT